MTDIIKCLNDDLAKEVMARENARRVYQGTQKDEKIAYHSGRIEYIQQLLEKLNKEK